MTSEFTPATINLMDRAGRTPLFLAVVLHNVTAVGLLLSEGADERIETQGYSPFRLARGIGNLTTMRLLFNAIVKRLFATDPPSQRDVNSQSTEGISLLHVAVLLDDVESVDILMRVGADPRLNDGNGNTPLTITRYILNPADNAVPTSAPPAAAAAAAAPPAAPEGQSSKMGGKRKTIRKPTRKSRRNTKRNLRRNTKRNTHKTRRCT